MGMQKDHNWTLHMMRVFPQKNVCCFFPLQLMFSPQRNVVDFPVGGDALAEHGKGMARHFEAMAAGVHHVVTVNGGIIWKIYNPNIITKVGNIHHLNHSPSGLTLFPWRSKGTQGTLQRSPPHFRPYIHSYWPPSTPSTGSSLPLGGGRYP